MQCCRMSLFDALRGGMRPAKGLMRHTLEHLYDKSRPEHTETALWPESLVRRYLIEISDNIIDAPVDTSR